MSQKERFKKYLPTVWKNIYVENQTTLIHSIQYLSGINVLSSRFIMENIMNDTKTYIAQTGIMQSAFSHIMFNGLLCVPVVSLFESENSMATI